jgi:hypothetical protein
MSGCGRGLIDYLRTNADTGNISHDAYIQFPDAYIQPADVNLPGPEVLPPNRDAAPYDTTAPITSITVPVGEAGDTLSLDGAALVIGQGTFLSQQPVTLQITTVDHSGAIGTVFKISVPSINLVQEDPTLTLQIPQNVPTSELPNLGIGVLDPSLPLAQQQWSFLQNPKVSQDQTSVTALATGLDNTSTLDYALVLLCDSNLTTNTACPACMACNAGVCQQCPTNSPCTCT